MANSDSYGNTIEPGHAASPDKNRRPEMEFNFGPVEALDLLRSVYAIENPPVSVLRHAIGISVAVFTPLMNRPPEAPSENPEETSSGN